MIAKKKHQYYKRSELMISKRNIDPAKKQIIDS